MAIIKLKEKKIKSSSCQSISPGGFL